MRARPLPLNAGVGQIENRGSTGGDMNMVFVTALQMLWLPVATVGAVPKPPEVNRFLETNWTVVHSIALTDQAVMAALKSRFGEDDRLADVGEPFEATDNVSGRPSRRLLMGGHADERWFVLYERGGRGHHLVLVVFNAATQPPTPMLLARGEAGTHDDIHGWGVDLAGLKTALRKGRMSTDDLAAHYY